MKNLYQMLLHMYEKRLFDHLGLVLPRTQIRINWILFINILQYLSFALLMIS